MDLTPFENMQDDPDNLLSEKELEENIKIINHSIVLLHGKHPRLRKMEKLLRA